MRILRISLLALAALVALFLDGGCIPGRQAAAPPEVVAYTSWDQGYSEPVLHEFEKRTGIRVRDKYDVEALKTTGLVQALIAEGNQPRCDVFWNNEPVQTCLIKEKGLLERYSPPYASEIPAGFRDPGACWTGISARARVILYNREKIGDAPCPCSVWDLTDSRWRGRCGIPSPLFGTSATHLAAIYTLLGAEKSRLFFRALKANEVKITDGNARLKSMISDGELIWGIVDTDDANVAITVDRKPVTMVCPDQPGGSVKKDSAYPKEIGTLVMPNTVMLIKGSPHPEEAKKLIDYLVSREVEERLARSEAVQIPLGRGAEIPGGVTNPADIKVMEVSWEGIASKWQEAMECIRQELLR
jgi:iron(III) transport system substrate-binding protein